MSTYGERLAEGLKRPGKDRKGLAKAMGVSPQAVGQLVRGTSKAATAANNVAAADYLGCDPNWLATGKGPSGFGLQILPGGPYEPSSAPASVHTAQEYTAPSLDTTLNELAALLGAMDRMTRDAIAPLLANLAHTPEEADSISAMISALVSARRKRVG